MTSPKLLDQLERRFERFAIPGLLRVIASFQVICFIIAYFKPRFLDVLMLTPAAWTNWEVWRFFTFCFVPSTTSLIWIIFAVMILLLIGDLLETEWGKFRLNLYYFSTILCLWAGVLISPPFEGVLVGLQASTLLYSSLFLAFATVVPNYTFLLFFVLPVKVKYLALLNGAFLAYSFISVPFMRLPLILVLIPYACFAIPPAIRRMKQGAKVQARRAEHQAGALPAGTPFHQCRVCQRSEQTDPHLEFRIAGDGEEYCADHLPASQT